MDIINSLFPLHKKYRDIFLALGTFDGVHLGHRKIIERVVKTARIHSGTSVVFTFDPHPRTVLNPDKPLPLLTTYDEKREIMASLGVDLFCVLPFHSEFAKMSPDEFVRDILVKFVGPRLVVVGPNYTFGRYGAGTPDRLAKLGAQFGFMVKVEDFVYVDGQPVSSTIIRKLINQGDLAKAHKLLARFFALSGEVMHGDGRGRGLGFPTANVALPAMALMPADGVYAVKVILGAYSYKGIANIGANPTFQVNQRRLEVHIFDFDAHIYGRSITVQFLQRIREERTFAHQGALIEQIERDIIFTRNILADYA